MNVKVNTSVERNGPLDVSLSISGQVIINPSKLKVVIPCAPARIGGGFKLSATGKTIWKGVASVETNLEDKLLHRGVSGLLGVSGSGAVHGGGFGLYDDKIVGANAEIYGSAGVHGKSTFAGDLGLGKNGNLLLDGKERLTGTGEYSGGATIGIATNEDALTYVQATEEAHRMTQTKQIHI